MRYLFFLLVCALGLPACAQKAKPHKNKALAASKAPAAKAATEPVLVFQRTPCNGTCPSYKAAIYADGRVEYEGGRFVSRLGKHTLRLPTATVNQMLAEAKRIDFYKFRDQYVGNTSDMPATIITVQLVGQPAKQVHAEENIPPALAAYATYLGQRLDQLAQGQEEQ